MRILKKKQEALKVVFDAVQKLIKASELFQSAIQNPVNPRGYWHGEALLVAHYTLEILRKFQPRSKHGAGKPTSPAVTITCRSLDEIYADIGKTFEPEAVVKAIRSEKRKNSNLKFV
ncbi:hypothetical protein [Acetobacter estunensis]|uniref:hypothetical protein n=1 Tax=Acetobacter estunensis TaxID=104097 RepID=UPI001C2DB58B|nr:hypothetical protein [Acetobacter estunensis]MBV1837170.1 hypothetical protein [Acetobacter estunensis]